MKRTSASAKLETVKTAAGHHVDDPVLATFEDVLKAERAEIQVRRHRANPNPKPDGDVENTHRENGVIPLHLVGLALSGGGIRSATFALGLLQALHRLNLLRAFDYLSTVSGGGYTGGWWSAWLSRPQPDGAVFPRAEQLEPDRWPFYVAGSALKAGVAAPSQAQPAPPEQAPPEGSLSAADRDPIHHLRLFANYLTPRKGLLSADTWRAVTILGRNLVLTWVVLIPVLVAAVLLGQLFFVSQGAPVSVGDTAALQERLQLLAKPVLVLALWLLVLVLFWLLNGIGRFVASLIGFAGVAVALWYVFHAFGGGAGTPTASSSSPWWTHGWTFMAAVGVLVIVFREGGPLIVNWKRKSPTAPDVRRNKLVSLQSTIVVALVVLVAALGVAGFGPDLVWYLFTPEDNHPVFEFVKKSGGVGAAVLAVGMSVFTAVKGAPSVSDAKRQQEPKRLSKLVFAIAPAFLLLVLAVVTSAGTQALVRSASDSTEQTLALSTWAAIGVLLFFAGYETIRDEVGLTLTRRLLIAGLPLGVALLTWRMMPPPSGSSRVLVLGGIGAVAIVTFGRLTSAAEAGRLVSFRRLDARFLGFLFGWPALVLLVMTAFVLAWVTDRLLPADVVVALPTVVAAAIAICGAFALAELIWLKAERWRAAGLVAVAFVASLSLTMPHIASARATAGGLPYATITLALAVISIGVVVGLGWMADPNQLSMHTFYKARLVRAYLGASNTHRTNQQITESEQHDDVPLASLANCERGAPYHVVNTTLNLVGGRDLTTAQRSADTFMLTRNYCGSPRTGYRRTSEYMRGMLTLGTAVAASGAAVSPSMGSKTPSAALAMLLTLFNVRLGYWAPTPDQARWRSPQARLWPFYTLRECLSQTTALSTYCYLTDGGHFDNTGLHALVARGCLHIVLSDCGADPKPCFEDIGNAIRRCRIDFGTEIKLGVQKLSHNSEDRRAKAHVVVGSIRYSREHADYLKWPRSPNPTADEESRTGVIVWIKPTLTGTVPADVQQYALENEAFPQQTTLDQWYDEAQFESYRALGAYSAEQAFGEEPYPDMKPEDVATEFRKLLERERERETGEPAATRRRDRPVETPKPAREAVEEPAVTAPDSPLSRDRRDEPTRTSFSETQ